MAIQALAQDPGCFAGDQDSLPPVVRTKQRTFSIPFRLPQPSSAEAAPRQVVMEASKDLGVSWETVGQVAPSAGSFTYSAPVDGEYWFRLRSIDTQGRLRGNAGPDMRVVVDAAGPKLVGRAWKGGDGEVVCRFAALDDSIRLESVVVEYRSAAEPEWKRVAAQPVLARESPAHLLGEEIWWAGEKTDGLVVRVSLTDASGNPVTKQFSLEPKDPQVDQTTLAGELGVPPLPGAGGGLATAPSPNAAFPGRSPTSAPAVAGPSGPNGGWPAEPAGPWSVESRLPSLQANPLRPAYDATQSVLARGNAAGEPSAVASETAGGLKFAAARVPSPAPTSAGAGAFGALAERIGGAGGAMEYRGRPLQIARSRRFAWDYEVPSPKPAGGARVELWGTRDGGITWQRFAEDVDGASPIDVQLAEPGLYGFRLEVAPASDPSEPPRSGEIPDSWLGIDEKAPEVEIVSVSRDDASAEPGRPRAILIRYSVRDPLLLPSSTTISYAPNPSGPFVPIADKLAPAGDYRWLPDRGVPARVVVRVEARDAAGNVGTATTPEEVVVSAPRSIGRLGGIHATPGDAGP